MSFDNRRAPVERRFGERRAVERRTLERRSPDLEPPPADPTARPGHPGAAPPLWCHAGEAPLPTLWSRHSPPADEDLPDESLEPE